MNKEGDSPDYEELYNEIRSLNKIIDKLKDDQSQPSPISQEEIDKLVKEYNFEPSETLSISQKGFIDGFNKCAELNAEKKRQVTNTGSFQTGL